MSMTTLNYLHQVLTYKFNEKTKLENNFSVYFKQVLLNSHFLTRIFVKVFLTLFIFFSYVLNFSSFNSLSFEKAELFLTKISRLPLMKIFIRIIKLYSYIYYFDHHNENIYNLVEDLSCDFLIVGSGAGGSVAAKELTSKGKDCILLEKAIT